MSEGTEEKQRKLRRFKPVTFEYKSETLRLDVTFSFPQAKNGVA
jgi:hypothetical protein